MRPVSSVAALWCLVAAASLPSAACGFAAQSPPQRTVAASGRSIVAKRRFGPTPGFSASSDDDEPTSAPGRDNPVSGALRAAGAMALSASLLLCPPGLGPTPPPASAADYNSLSDEQRQVTEAWRLLDGSYFERTFNRQDWFKVRQDAVKKKYKGTDEVREAVDKMASGLGDKYTRYLAPNKYQSIVDAATGQLAGVGVEISKDLSTGMIIASDVEPSSPAAGGGIKKGDAFLEVDGTRMDDGKATPDDVAANLRGPVGSKVGVVMERSGKTLDYILTREPIKITSVRSYMSSKDGGKVGVVRIKSFSGTTSETVSETLKDLKSKGAKAFVLDVRNNPGGLLPGGIDTASLFLDNDKPVVFVMNKNNKVESFATLAAGLDLDSPLVVFVNGNTASAAEVMTAALKENERAVIVGDAGGYTFGKGVVQTIRGLGEGRNGGLAITVARYETPKRNDINKQGIKVDLETSQKCDDEDVVVCIPKGAFKSPQA